MPPKLSLQPSTVPRPPAYCLASLPTDLQADPIFAHADHTSALTLAFSCTDHRLYYLNKNACQRLDPNQETQWHDITLEDLIGVGTTDRLRGEILAHTEVLSRWSGECTLCDMWGSEFRAHCTFFIHRPPIHPAEKFLVLQATELHGDTATGLNDLDRHYLHVLLETSPDCIYFKDTQSRFLRVSRTLSERCGVANPRHMIGKTDFDFFTTEHATPAYQDEQHIIRTGEHLLNKIERETWANGIVTWVSTTKLPLRDHEGKIIGTYGISRDVTLEKAAEEQRQETEIQLQLSSKLESIGRLAAGVAHEINTPTQYITDNTLFLKDAFDQLLKAITAHRQLQTTDSLPDPEQAAEIDYLLAEIPKTIRQTIDGLDRVTRIVRSLKEFSHPNAPGKNPANLNDTIQTAITVSRHEWKLVADLVTDLDPDLPHVPCILDQFNQVLLNLIVNAAHSIGDALKARGETKGTITLRTRHNPTHALIEITDTGMGIPAEIRDRIFEPFFTTKAVGKGTGQGLNVVRTVIAEHHQGLIDIETTVGQGTTFRLHLPLTDPTLHRTPPAS